MDIDVEAALRKVWREVVCFGRDWRRAQRLLLEWQLAPERFVFTPSGVPATYAEFLFLTAGPRPHEPSARERGRGPSRRR
jgi:hypothetical protein